MSITQGRGRKLAPAPPHPSSSGSGKGGKKPEEWRPQEEFRKLVAMPLSALEELTPICQGEYVPGKKRGDLIKWHEHSKHCRSSTYTGELEISDRYCRFSASHMVFSFDKALDVYEWSGLGFGSPLDFQKFKSRQHDTLKRSDNFRRLVPEDIFKLKTRWSNKVDENSETNLKLLQQSCKVPSANDLTVMYSFLKQGDTHDRSLSEIGFRSYVALQYHEF